ncbi:MAG: chorismate lyase [Halothiobacillaceae bacterium]|nr:chorismate lyase [Halothiobacillaceae bacterium]
MNRHQDHFWNRAALGCGADMHPWLHDHGSLTARIQQRCERFAVHPVRSGLARIACDEAAVLGIAPHRLAYSREVFLHADCKPAVFAHSACRADDLRGAWQAMKGLGNRSLGSLLFTHPLVVRHPLHFAALRPHHPLYQSAISAIDSRPDRLWARRSLFTLRGAPLLVTEVFLPAILKLGLRNEVIGLSLDQASDFC